MGTGKLLFIPQSPTLIAPLSFLIPKDLAPLWVPPALSPSLWDQLQSWCPLLGCCPQGQGLALCNQIPTLSLALLPH